MGVQEAQAWAHVRPHPNIVRFYDAWMEPAAKPEGAEHCFIWLEKCGETVGQRVRCGGDPFTEPELIELLKQVTPPTRIEFDEQFGSSVSAVDPGAAHAA